MSDIYDLGCISLHTSFLKGYTLLCLFILSEINKVVSEISKQCPFIVVKVPLSPDDDILDLSSEDEAVACDLDMHTLILGGLHQDTEPLKTADEVIQEIDDMMQEDSPSLDRSPGSRESLDDPNDSLEKGKEVLNSPLYEDSK